MQATDHKEYEAQGFHNLDKVQGCHILASKQLSPLIRRILKTMWAYAMEVPTFTQALCCAHVQSYPTQWHDRGALRQRASIAGMCACWQICMFGGRSLSLYIV